MKKVMKGAKILTYVLFTIIILASALLAIILWIPEKILTPHVLHKLATKLPSLGYAATWSNDFIKIKSHSLFEKEIEMKFENLCIDMPNIAAKGCFKVLKVNAIVRFQSGKINLIDLGPAIVKSDNLDVTLKTQAESKQSQKPGLFSEFFGHFTTLHEIEIDVKKFKYALKDSTYISDLKVKNFVTNKNNNAWGVGGIFAIKVAETGLQASGDLHLLGSGVNKFNPLQASGNIHVSQKGKIEITSSINYKFMTQSTGDYQVKFDLAEEKILNVRGEVSGNLEPAKTKGVLKALLSNSDFTVPIGDKRECHFDVTFNGAIGLDCPFEFLPKTDINPELKLSQYLSAIQMNLKGKIKSQGSLDPNDLWSGELDLAVETKAKVPFQLKGAVTARLSKTPLNGEIINKLNIKSDVKFLVPQFQEITALLKDTSFAVPAPVNTLSGNIECNLKGEFVNSNLQTPFDCKTNLASNAQALKLDANGTFGLAVIGKIYKPDLKLNLILDDIRLALPQFGLKGPPAVIPDSRFKKSVFAKTLKKQTPLNYRIHVTTVEKNPIHLISNLSKEQVPISLDLVVSSAEPLEGSLQINEFTAELFRRKAAVKYFKLKISAVNPELINGLIIIKHTDYTIKILIGGTFEEPTVVFESNPPVPQNQIVSILLFGRKLDESDSGQASSVSNTQAAVTDKALALSSMYVLASTPIESVGYDSQSQTFTAKVHLAEGTSFNVGADDSGVNQVGINRHLGGPWFIYTYVKNPSASQERSSAAFLEWVKRY